MNLIIALVNAFAAALVFAGVVLGFVGPHIWPSLSHTQEVKIVVMHDQSMTITATGYRATKPNTAHHHHP